MTEREVHDTDRLVLECVSASVFGSHIDMNDARIERSGSGKPYLAGPSGVHFSVSHSAGIRACLVAAREVGLDIQEMGKARYIDIAERHFTSGEMEYISRRGPEGFFEIWTRKEAMVKCLGVTLMSNIGTPVAGEGGLFDVVETGGKTIRIVEVDISDRAPGMKCAAAYEIKGEETFDPVIKIRWI